MKVDCEERVNRDRKKIYVRKISDNSTNTQDSDSHQHLLKAKHCHTEKTRKKRSDPRYKS